MAVPRKSLRSQAGFKTKGIKLKPRKISIFCTLGPSSMDKGTIAKLDSLGVDMFRVNLSHTKLEDLRAIIKKIRSCTKKDICLDTEGAQIRVGRVDGGRICLRENDTVEITAENVIGKPDRVSFAPGFVIRQIVPGDLVSIDFEAVLLQVVEKRGDSIKSKVISGGHVGSNKAVTVDRDMVLPVISEKDKKAVVIGRKEGIRHFALSFAGSGRDVEYFRKIAGRGAHVISKIESKKGLENVDDILAASDSILIDRGDLSREEPIEKIPFLQKLIVKKANAAGVSVYVATNLLESMVKGRIPTRAEVNDIVNTLMDGASGLVLAAETAIGSYPIDCVRMVSKTIKQFNQFSVKTSLEKLQQHESFLLVDPHGGRLVDGMKNSIDIGDIKKYKSIKVDNRVLMDAEQIALGTFSPIEGFMSRKELESVIRDYMLPNGIVWPLPITLQVDKNTYKILKKEESVVLASADDGEAYAILHIDSMYEYDLDKIAVSVFGTNDIAHPGVKYLKNGGPYFVSGKVDLLKRLPSRNKYLEITPKQARAIFENKGWTRVVGFHTRNVIHRVHEYIQKLAMEKYNCDGIFIHPVVGPKKEGDYHQDVILKTYELMMDRFYPPEKTVLGAFQSYPRYAGPREAVFTALCRKNFGCSHFIVGRDHTGVGDYYKHYDVRRLFDRLGDIGILPIFFQEMNYCKKCNDYVEKCMHKDDILRISGSRAREILKLRKTPPSWFMRREISNFILSELKKGEKVFMP